jgi:integrase
MKSTSKKRTPNIVNLTVKRRYLTEREVERLMNCARKQGRYGHRDATMILVAYRHGLRASEVCNLQWQQIELSEGRLHKFETKKSPYRGVASGTLIQPRRNSGPRADLPSALIRSEHHATRTVQSIR